ncbi:hypothetical protein [Thomasclavelia sp.]
MKEIYTLRLDKYDYGVILNTLNDRRTQMLNQKQDTEIIDNTLLKVIEAKEKAKGCERSER